MSVIYSTFNRPTLDDLILQHPVAAIEICERLADEMDERERYEDGEGLRDLADMIADLIREEGRR